MFHILQGVVLTKYVRKAKKKKKRTVNITDDLQGKTRYWHFLYLPVICIFQGKKKVVCFKRDVVHLILSKQF